MTLVAMECTACGSGWDGHEGSACRTCGNADTHLMQPTVPTLLGFIMDTKGLNQKQIAALLSITPQYLHDLLVGRRGLSAEVAAKLEAMRYCGRRLYLDQAAAKFEVAREALKEPKKK